MSRARQAALHPFRTHLIAHRGLFDNATDWPENTLPAFERAVQAGYGIELDVMATKDGQIVVIHDDRLDRLCGETVAVAELTYDELRQRRILGSDQPVPLFTQALDVIAGQVPLIVEIKYHGDLIATCQVVDAILRDYDGPYCVESFDPRALMWYRRHHPDVLRGQLADDFPQELRIKGWWQAWALANLLFTPLTNPDFIAYNHEHSTKFALWFWCRLLGCTPVAWTIHSQAHLDRARHRFGVFIFDGFVPDGGRDE